MHDQSCVQSCDCVIRDHPQLVMQLCTTGGPYVTPICVTSGSRGLSHMYTGSISGSDDWLRFGLGATNRQFLLRSPVVVAYRDWYWLVVGHRTIGRTRGRAINNDWTTLMCNVIKCFLAIQIDYRIEVTHSQPI